jgi:dihydropyrimidine dehydrogenase (NAD+) subunit PreA
MADLSIDIGATHFKNPLMAAGATPTLTVHNMRKCIEAGIGAIEWKSITENPVSLRWQYPANWFLDHDGLRGELLTWETAFVSLKGALQQLREIKPLAAKEDVRLIPNLALEDVMDLRPFGGPPPEVSMDQWVEFARECEKEGADIIVVNGPCPVVIGDQGPVTMSWFMDWYDEAVPPIIDTLKKASGLPVWVKSNREFYPRIKRFADVITKMAPAVAHVGAAVSRIQVDIERAVAYTPVSMPYLKGHVSWAVAAISANTPVPVVSGGNMQTARDCIERIMCGARGCLVAAEIMHRGYGVITEMAEGISKFMDRKGYARVEDMVGLAVPTIQLDEDRMVGVGLEAEYNALMAGTEVTRESVVMRVDPNKCNGCKKCLVCLFEAITMKNGVAEIDPAVCERCGCCPSLCPTEAITFTHPTDFKNFLAPFIRAE